MGFFDLFKKKFSKEAITKQESLTYVLVGEAPSPVLYQKLGYSFFGEKEMKPEFIESALKKKNVYLIFANKKKFGTKNKRISRIKKAYDSIKPNFEGSTLILLLHDYIFDAIGEKLKQDFPLMQVKNLGFCRSMDDFKNMINDAFPIGFERKKLKPSTAA